MKNPKKNRAIGYAVLFSGFILFAKSSSMVNNGSSGSIALALLFIISLSLIVFSYFWMFRTVRCPHCNNLLQIKLYNIDVCPKCGKRTY